MTILTTISTAGTRCRARAKGAAIRNLCLAATALVSALAMSPPTFAHHSYAAFDMLKQTEFPATVKSFLWTNPHSLLVVSATIGGKQMSDYHIEMNGPGYLVRNGWKRDSLKPGDKITVTVHPLRNGEPGGDLVMVMFPDGRTLRADAKPPGLLVPDASTSQEKQ